jgi:hypothetical protein
MDRLMFKLAVALMTYTIGVSAAFYLLRRQPVRVYEEPPCGTCARVYGADPEGFGPWTIPFSVLASDPGQLTGRLVRVRANLENDAGYISLYAPGPRLEGTRLPAEFNDPASYAACGGVREALHDIAGIGNWCDGSAEVVVVGRVGRLGHFRHGEVGFEIMCVERAKPLGAHAR